MYSCINSQINLLDGPSSKVCCWGPTTPPVTHLLPFVLVSSHLEQENKYGSWIDNTFCMSHGFFFELLPVSHRNHQLMGSIQLSGRLIYWCVSILIQRIIHGSVFFTLKLIIFFKTILIQGPPLCFLIESQYDWKVLSCMFSVSHCFEAIWIYHPHLATPTTCSQYKLYWLRALSRLGPMIKDPL